MCFPLAKKTEFGDKIGDTWSKGTFSVQVFPPSPDWETGNEENKSKEHQGTFCIHFDVVL